MTEWETKLRDFSSGTCHDDCCQENASLANAVDAALAEVERLHSGLKRGEGWIRANRPDTENGAFVVDVLLAEIEHLRFEFRRIKEVVAAMLAGEKMYPQVMKMLHEAPREARGKENK